MKRPPADLLKSLQEAEALLASGKVNKAAQSARRAYFLAEKHLPVSHPSRHDAARMLGQLLLNLNQKSEAERLLRESGDVPASPDAAADVDQRNNQATIRVQQASLSPDTIAL